MTRKDFEPKKQLETPYQRAREVIDRRVGLSRKEAYNWRLFALGSLAVGALAVGGLIWQSMKARVVPYVVELDGEGAVRLVGTPATETYRPSEGVRRKFLEDWLFDVRERSSDKTVVRQNLMDAYEVVTGKAKGQLDTLLEDEKPFEFIERHTRQLKVLSINKVAERNWRIEWREDVFNDEGFRQDSAQYVGILKLTHERPETKKEAKKNPLGLYVTHFSMNRRAKPNAKEGP